MQAVGHLVQFDEAGGHAAGQPALRRDRVDLVHGGLQQVFQRHKVFGHPPVGDVVDLGLSAVDHVGDVGALRTGIAVLHDARAGLHQPPQQRLLRDDACVVAGVGGGRHGGDQGVQIGRAADAAQQPAAVQLGGDGDRVGGLAAAVEIEDGVVDVLVGRTVEVAGPEALEHIGNRVLAQQHAAEDGLLGRLVLRGLTTEVLTGRRNIHARMAEVIHDSHGGATSSPGRTYIRYRYRDCRSDLRRPPPCERRYCLATANARRCWNRRIAALFMNLWMECG